MGIYSFKTSLRQKMKLKESHTIELKPSLAQLDDALKSVCAFLNHKGGIIYFGVSDKGKVIGMQISDNTLRKVSQQINSRIKPEISPEIKEIKEEGKSILEVKILQGNNKPYFLNGIAYKRVGSEKRIMPPDELKQIIIEQKQTKWDEEVCEGAILQDIDEYKVRWFLRKAKAERNFDVDPETPIKETLERLNFIKKGKLTNASIMLFGKNPQKFFLQARIRCARFKGITAVDFIDMKLIDGNIIDQVDKAETFVLSHIKKAAKIVMFKREEVWEYPIDALREAIINSICHRDYSISGNIKISILDDRIEISNPGHLPGLLTPSMLKKKHDSILRNPLIASSFFLIKNIEQWGKGTNKIVKWCVEHGLKEPDFEEIGGGFEVIFYAPEEILKLIPEKGKINLQELGLNDRQIEALRLMLNEDYIFTNKKYREHFKIGDATAKRDLIKLVKLGFVEHIGIGRAIKYKAK